MEDSTLATSLEAINSEREEYYAKKIAEIVDYYLNSNQGRELSGFTKEAKEGGSKLGKADLGGTTEYEVSHDVASQIIYKSIDQDGRSGEPLIEFSFSKDAKSSTIRVSDRRDSNTIHKTRQVMPSLGNAPKDDVAISSKNNNTFEIYYGIRGAYDKRFINNELLLVENSLGKEVEKAHQASGNAPAQASGKKLDPSKNWVATV